MEDVFSQSAREVVAGHSLTLLRASLALMIFSGSRDDTGFSMLSKTVKRAVVSTALVVCNIDFIISYIHGPMYGKERDRERKCLRDLLKVDFNPNNTINPNTVSPTGPVFVDYKRSPNKTLCGFVTNTDYTSCWECLWPN